MFSLFGNNEINEPQRARNDLASLGLIIGILRVVSSVSQEGEALHLFLNTKIDTLNASPFYIKMEDFPRKQSHYQISHLYTFLENEVEYDMIVSRDVTFPIPILRFHVVHTCSVF